MADSTTISAIRTPANRAASPNRSGFRLDAHGIVPWLLPAAVVESHELELVGLLELVGTLEVAEALELVGTLELLVLC